MIKSGNSQMIISSHLNDNNLNMITFFFFCVCYLWWILIGTHGESVSLRDGSIIFKNENKLHCDFDCYYYNWMM